MTKPFIFVSCGQFTEAEKRLGKQIVNLVKTVTGLDAFFAEEVQDLNGLDSNILTALRECAGFITVMHPRGKIVRPGGSEHVRASVWIEQEIAIATYIQRVERRELPVIAFVHQDVGREGIRELLHLNPEPFVGESDVLAALPERLLKWKNLLVSGRRVELRSVSAGLQDGHPISQLEVMIVNDSNKSIDRLNGMVRVPAAILKHWSATYPLEVKSGDPNFRCFRFDEKNFGSTPPHDTRRLITLSYCTKCALGPGELPLVVAQATVEVKMWIEGREYAAQNTIEAWLKTGKPQSEGVKSAEEPKPASNRTGNEKRPLRNAAGPARIGVDKSPSHNQSANSSLPDGARLDSAELLVSPAFGRIINLTNHSNPLDVYNNVTSPFRPFCRLPAPRERFRYRYRGLTAHR